jgi:PAS domain S-box-containing protein
MTGYISVEPYQLEKTGVHVHTILPVNYGIDFYGDLLFTSTSLVKNNPTLVEKFKRASFKGWEYAMKNPNELADHILTLPGVTERNVTKESLLNEAEQMQHLILPGLVEIGHMNDGRWQHILDIHQSLGLIDRSVTLDGFLYDPEKTASNRLLNIILYSGIAAALIIAVFVIYNLSLRRAVRKRTRELEEEVKARIKTQEQLQVNKERLNLAIQAAGIGIWDWDAENDAITFGDSAATNLGYSPDEFLNTREYISSKIHPDDLTALLDYIELQLQSDAEIPGTIIRLKTKSDEWKWCLLISKAVKRNHNNKALHLSGIFLNVNELKKKEVELSDLSSTLLKRNKELQQFAYITSHNLRSPVANLLSLTRLYKKEELGEHNKVYFEKIQECIAILNETLNDVNEILSFRTVAAEKMSSVPLEVELQTVTASISEQITTTNTTIVSDFLVKEIWFSKRIIRSIFQNLVTNAIKYRRKYVSPVIRITSSEDKEYYNITVEDNGQGIDLEQYGDKVFALFQRFHTGVDGKGMGLYIIKTQLETLNGKITLSSKVNRGTIFTVHIPKKELQS